ncbi:hypothetical protein C8Q76DRAFT_691119 [Earliella scabrosa]|nr:hypothetical protein C8Q76DRAFT_691119 [Earliella scabrosa]
MQPDSSQTDVTMILTRGSTIETQLTVISTFSPPSTHYITPLYLLAMKSSFSRALTSLQYIQNWVLVYCWLQVLLLAVLLMQNKGITDTLMASSVPLVGRVTADTLMASSVPLVGRAIVTDSLSKSPVRGLEGTLLTSLSLSTLWCLSQDSIGIFQAI